MNRDQSVKNAAMLGELTGKVDLMLGRQDSLAEAIYGNGDPSKGMSSRIERIETNLATASAVCESSAKSISLLAKSVDDHHRTIHLSTLLRDKRFWGYLAITFLAVSVLVDVLRPLFVALVKAWTGIDLPA